MDAFKAAEIERMRFGGNQPWKDFFDKHKDSQIAGVTWDDATIAERYSGDVGEEWKERLTSKVEGREYVAATKPVAAPRNLITSNSGDMANSRSQTPTGIAGGRTASPSLADAKKAKVDDRYFARLGADNASRPADLPPSQGGKYAGFGSAPPEPVQRDQKLPGFDDLQKDPVAALTKGFGWFTNTVGKTAKTVNEGYIQPTAQKLAEADLAAQARVTAAQLAKTAQTGARGATDSFNRFVEGSGDGGSGGYRRTPIDETKKDFWDSFGKPAESESSSIGTAAMKKTSSNGGMAGGMGSSSTKEGDEWDKW